MRILASLLLVCSWTWSPIFADDHLLSLLKCHKGVVGSPGVYNVTLRLYPITPIQKSIGSNRIAIASAFGEYDAFSTAFGHLQRQQLKNSARSDSTNPTPGYVPNILAHPYTPDTVILIRGNQATVFPRVFLASPRIASSAAVDGDLIATLYFTDPSLEIRPVTERDPFRVFVREQHDQQDGTAASSIVNARRIAGSVFAALGSPIASILLARPVSRISVDLTGPLLAGDQRGRKNIPAGESIGTFLDTENGLAKEIEPAIARQHSGTLSNLIPVCVVIRHMDGVTVRYVTPLSTTGIFGKSGIAMRSLFRDAKFGRELNNEALIDRWDELFERKIRNIHLQDGDVLEFTTIDLVSPFNEIAFQ